MSVALVVGHHPQAKGAVLTVGDLSIQEYDLWQPLARELAQTLRGHRIESTVVLRPNEDPDEELAERINDTGADCAVELHFNAAASKAAQGTEMLYWADSSDGKRLARHLHDTTTDRLGTDPRGLKPVMSGYPVLRLTEMPAVIAEPAFGSNSEDAWTLLTGQADVLEAYRTAIRKWHQPV